MNFKHKKSFWLIIFSLVAVSATFFISGTLVIRSQNNIKHRNLAEVLYIWGSISVCAIPVVAFIFAFVEKCKIPKKSESDSTCRILQGDHDYTLFSLNKLKDLSNLAHLPWTKLINNILFSSITCKLLYIKQE